MTFTKAIGSSCEMVISLIVRALSLSRIHPNVLTFFGLLVNAAAAAMLASGKFLLAGVIIMAAGLFDMVDGRVARETNRVTRFGGFFDSVLDRYSDLVLLMGLLVYYASINRFFYVVLTAVVMTGIGDGQLYARARRVHDPALQGGLHGASRARGADHHRRLFDRMAPVLWVIAVLANLTVIHRMLYTWRETRRLEETAPPKAAVAVPAAVE